MGAQLGGVMVWQRLFSTPLMNCNHQVRGTKSPFQAATAFDFCAAATHFSGSEQRDVCNAMSVLWHPVPRRF